MTHSVARWAICLLVFGFCSRSSGADQPLEETASPPTRFARFAESKQEADILRKLQQRIDIDYRQVPLNELLGSLSSQADVTIQLGDETLNRTGLSGDEKLDLKRSGIRIERVLDLIAEPLGLIWLIDEGQVQFMEAFDSEQVLTTRAYAVGPILQRWIGSRFSQPPVVPVLHAAFGDLGQLAATLRQNPYAFPLPIDEQTLAAARNRDALIDRPSHGPAIEQLREFLTHVVRGPWLDQHGMGGTIDVYGQTLLVRQHWQAHRQIERVLVALDELLSAAPAKSIRLSDSSATHAEIEAIENTLRKTLRVEFKGEPLTDAVQALEKQVSRAIEIDRSSLLEEGLKLEVPVSFDGQATLDSILRRLLEPHGLRYLVDGDRILITTDFVFSDRYQWSLHQVSDLTGGSNPELVSVRLDQLRKVLLEVLWEDAKYNAPAAAFGAPQPLALDPPIEPVAFGTCIAVRHNRDIGVEIGKLLATLRSATAREEAALEHSIEFYPLDRSWNSGQVHRSLAALMKADAWDRGSLTLVEDVLIVDQDAAAHATVRNFLAHLKRARGARNLHIGIQGAVIELDPDRIQAAHAAPAKPERETESTNPTPPDEAEN